MDHLRTAGWDSDFPTFRGTPVRVIRLSLEQFVEGATAEQRLAWDHSIPLLQAEVGEVCETHAVARTYTAILEYQLPLDARRADAIFLVSGAVVVIELKGKVGPTQADIDQAASYGRDLRAYHRECQDRPVHVVLLPTGCRSAPLRRDGVWVVGPPDLDRVVTDLVGPPLAAPPSVHEFLDVRSYRPLPSLVQAARELFHRKEVREVWRARAATDPAVERIAALAVEAAATRTRRLILLTGVPGSGKTLVGLRAVHAGYLDELAVERAGGPSTSPALFLSGNGPLVQVLQYVLRGGGGGGRTFVRHIKDYLDAYVPRPERLPSEHMLVFDEAQRAFTADKVRETHPRWPASLARGEPHHFIELCDRVPEWAVMVGLLGTGQEIHLGEEGGVEQWREAILESPNRADWTIHAPADLETIFSGSEVATRWEPSLNLDTELRFHLASALHEFLGEVLGPSPRAHGASLVADRLWRPRGDTVEGLRLWITRDLQEAKAYLHERYADDAEARYGILASSRDQLLALYGIDNTWDTTRRVRVGPWFADGAASPHSCRRLEACITEFQVQGLELEMALVAWGADYRRHGGRWTDERARRYRAGRVRLRDPFRLRMNAYRVLLSRGRDGTVVFVPPDHLLDETWEHLLASGFRELRNASP